MDSHGGSPGGEIRTFLIADVRGYTHFTEEHGDERAAELAKKFARLARSVVADNGGEVIEVRGDEALAVFTSARLALRPAVELQRRSRTDGALPLGIGIGLDAGEAMPSTAVPGRRPQSRFTSLRDGRAGSESRQRDRRGARAQGRWGAFHQAPPGSPQGN